MAMTIHKFKCPYCDKEFCVLSNKCDGYLKAHIRTKHRGKMKEYKDNTSKEIKVNRVSFVMIRHTIRLEQEVTEDLNNIENKNEMSELQ